MTVGLKNFSLSSSRRGLAPNTLIAYKRDLEKFDHYLKKRGIKFKVDKNFLIWICFA